MKDKAKKARKVMRRWAPVRALGYAGIDLHQFLKTYLWGCIPAPVISTLLAMAFGHIYQKKMAGAGSAPLEGITAFLERPHTLVYTIFGLKGQENISLSLISFIVCFMLFAAVLALLVLLDVIMYICNRLWDMRFRKLIIDTADDGILFDDWAGENILKGFDEKDRKMVTTIIGTNGNFKRGWSSKLK